VNKIWIKTTYKGWYFTNLLKYLKTINFKKINLIQIVNKIIHMQANKLTNIQAINNKPIFNKTILMQITLVTIVATIWLIKFLKKSNLRTSFY
jgi:hypothetical protein